MSDARKKLFRFWPAGYAALQQLHLIVKESGLEPALLELVKLARRRSTDARSASTCTRRMRGRRARPSSGCTRSTHRRETSFFTERERAALELTEVVTLVAQTHVPDAAVEQASAVFSPEELMRLLYAIIEINAWNRLGVTVGAPEPGSYDPATNES